MTITKEEFAEQYARNSGVTIAQLRAWDRIALPCECDYEDCQGWKMGHASDIIVAYERGQRRIAELEALINRLLQTDTAQESLRGKYVLAVDEFGVQGCAFCNADYNSMNLPPDWEHQSDCPLAALTEEEP